MKANEVKIGQTYTAKVSNRVVPVRIDSKHSKQGWNATNTKTGKRVHIKTAQRLRRAVKSDAKPAADVKPAKAAKPDVPPTVEIVTDQPLPKNAKPAKTRSSKPTGDTKPKRVSALDAAAQVLQAAGQPMNSKALIAAMAEQGLWSSPNGKTPHATLYAAMLREIKAKGEVARFRKVERGHFEYAG